MVYIISAKPSSLTPGGISTSRATAKDALDKALAYEANGFASVKVRDDVGNEYDVAQLRRLIDSVRVHDA